MRSNPDFPALAAADAPAAPASRFTLTASGRAFAQISRFHPELTAFRRDLHAHPELGFEEVYTSGRVAEALTLCGVDAVHRGIGKTGVVAVIRGRQSARAGAGVNPMVALRADMDALTMTEHNSFGWRSSRPGVMHGCGHDGHTTMLVGAARYLAATRNFAGDAVLVFQPAEEGRGGATAMINDGLFERFPVLAIYAMHNWPAMQPGTIGLNAGPMMAAADRITITVTGKGGHGAHAYLTVDPVLAAAHIITALQSIVARNVAPLDQGVVTIGMIHAGTAGNVIPDTVELTGTIRAFKDEVMALLRDRITAVVNGVAAAMGVSANLRFSEIVIPPTVNDPAMAAVVRETATELVGAQNMDHTERTMGAEDASYFLRAVPGAYVFVGAGNKAAGIAEPHHSPRFQIDEDALPLSVAIVTASAIKMLG